MKRLFPVGLIFVIGCGPATPVTHTAATAKQVEVICPMGAQFYKDTLAVDSDARVRYFDSNMSIFSSNLHRGYIEYPNQCIVKDIK